MMFCFYTYACKKNNFMNISNNFNFCSYTSIHKRKQHSAVNFKCTLNKETGMIAVCYLTSRGGFNSKTLGEKIGLSNIAVGQISSGKRRLTESEIITIESILGDEISLFKFQTDETLEQLAERLNLTKPIVRQTKKQPYTFKPSSITSRVDNQIGKERLERGITQTQMAKILGIGENSLIKKENFSAWSAVFNVCDLYYYSHFFRMPVDYFEKFFKSAGNFGEKDYSSYKPSFDVLLPKNILKSRVKENFKLLLNKKNKTPEEIKALKSYGESSEIEAADIFDMLRAFKLPFDYFYSNPVHNKTVIKTQEKITFPTRPNLTKNR